MTSRWFAALVILLSVAGGASAAVAPGNYIRTLSFGGVDRTYRLHVPPGYDGGAEVPLVINIHGFTSNALQQEAISNILPIADREGFIVVHPEGIANAWNAGLCCGNAGIDDVGFVRTVVADVTGQARIDRARIYVTGLSNGGAMSQRLACEAADLFAASAPMAFPIPFDPVTVCQPSRPIAVMTGMGLTDVLVHYTGDVFPSAAETFARWKAIDGCTAAAPEETVVTGASRCETYTQCDAGVEARLCSITADSFIGTPFEGHVLYLNSDIDLSEEIWTFLQRFTLPSPPSQAILTGANQVRSGRTRGHTDIAWTVAFDGETWTAADGSGHVYTGTALRKGKSKTWALTPSETALATLGAVASEQLAGLGATGDVTVDPRATLQLMVDRDGVPVRIKGALRLLRGGAPAGRVSVKAKS